MFRRGQNATLAPSRGAESDESDSEITIGRRREYGVGFSSIATVNTPHGCRDAGLTPVTDGRMPVFDGGMPGSRGRGRGRSLRSYSWERNLVDGERRLAEDLARPTDVRRDRVAEEMAKELEELHAMSNLRTPFFSGRDARPESVQTDSRTDLNRQPTAATQDGPNVRAADAPVTPAARDANRPTTPGIGSNRFRTGDEPSEPMGRVERAERVASPRPERRLATSTLSEMDNKEGSIRYSKGTLPTLRLAPFEGSKPLETFLAKFDNCVDYYNWTERERLCHLRASLDGEAAHVLCDVDRLATSDDLIRMLRKRFGNQDQRERFRAELKAISRRDGATLQSAYSEVRRVMALAFPGERGNLWETLARDTFLSALRDETLRQRILERDPQTLDDTLKIACHLEAIGRPSTEPSFDDQGRRRVKATYGQEAADERNETNRRLRQLESTIDKYRDELERYRTENAVLRQSMPTPPHPTMAPTWTMKNDATRYELPTYHPDMAMHYAVEPTPVSHQPPPVTATAATPKADAGQRRAPAGLCFSCGQPGHRARECPRKLKAAGVIGGCREANQTYIDIDVCGTRCHCLLDTGSEVSIVPKKYVPTAKLTPTSLSVFAANGTKIPILGCLRLAFTVQGIPLVADLLVSEAVE